MTDDIVLIPLSNSQVGALSLKTQEIVYKLDTSDISQSKPLGEVMAIKNCMLENNIILVAYESGVIGLWDVRKRSVHHWLDTKSCPMAMSFDNYWMQAIVGNPTDKLEVIAIEIFL